MGVARATDVDLQARLDAYWSGRAPAYHHRQLDSERAAADRQVWSAVFTRALAAVPMPARVLDVGCGSGYVANVIAELGYGVLGVDSSPGMVEEATEEAARRHEHGLPAAAFARMDGVGLDGGFDRPFDALVSRYVLWTLRDPLAAVRRWIEVVRPGGVIAAVDANWYPGGIDEVAVESSDGPDAFNRAYDDRVAADLPLATASSPELYEQLFLDAGLSEVHLVALPEIADLDRRFGVSPGHEPRPQFLLTGRTPHRP